MGIYDRDYNRSGYSGGSAGIRFVLPPITPVVKTIIIVNFSIFVVSFLIRPLGILIDSLFAVSTLSPFQSLQVWRVITYQFLHDGPMHIIFNMLMLYFFGPTLENLWGGKRFLRFYLICGAMGGFVYPLCYYIGIPGVTPNLLVGASGAILGIIAATAVLYPRAMVYVFGIIPVTMLVLVGIIVVFSAYAFMAGQNVGGELAHFAGLGAGAVYVLWQPWMQKTRIKMNEGRWQKKIAAERDLHASVDQILDKVHKSGMKSLTRKEKQILKKATEQEQRK